MKERFRENSPDTTGDTLRYKLAEVWTGTEARNRTVDQQKELEEKYLEAEAILEDKDLVDALREYAIDPSGIEREPNGLFRLPVRSHFSGVRLPEADGQSIYAYMGGAARALLVRSLQIDPSYSPRDIDIVGFGPEPKVGLDAQVAQRFMPEDYSHGHGVERHPSLEEGRDTYLSTRDLTLNEVLATDELIWTTRQGLLDTVRRVIRITPFEYSRYEDGIQPKMLAKILRLYTEGIERWGDVKIAHDGWQFGEAFIQPFWLAVQLDKACEQSLSYGQAYVNELISRGQLPPDVGTVEDAAEYLSQHLYDFSFRYAPAEQFEVEDEWANHPLAQSRKQVGHRRQAQSKSK